MKDRRHSWKPAVLMKNSRTHERQRYSGKTAVLRKDCERQMHQYLLRKDCGHIEECGTHEKKAVPTHEDSGTHEWQRYSWENEVLLKDCDTHEIQRYSWKVVVFMKACSTHERLRYSGKTAVPILRKDCGHIKECGTYSWKTSKTHERQRYSWKTVLLTKNRGINEWKTVVLMKDSSTNSWQTAELMTDGGTQKRMHIYFLMWETYGLTRLKFIPNMVFRIRNFGQASTGTIHLNTVKNIQKLKATDNKHWVFSITLSNILKNLRKFKF